MHEQIFYILNQVINNNDYSNHLLRQNKFGQDHKKITKIVMGVLKNKYLLDENIKIILKKNNYTKKIDNETKVLLEIMLYEKYFLNGIPDYAIVSEATKIAKEKHFNSQTFINWFGRVLHDYQFQKKITTYNHLKNMTINYSAPSFLITMLQTNYPQDYLEILSYFQKPNLNYGHLLKDNSNLNKYILPNTIKETNQLLHDMEEFKNNEMLIQDFSSQIVSHIARQNKGSFLDVTSGNGFKLISIAPHYEDITANDLYEKKTAQIKINLQKYQKRSVQTYNIDYTKDYIKKEFDQILIDAPCSGIGTISRYPEIKLKLKEKNIAKLVKMQKNILKNARHNVKNGGYLIYAVCSINPLEGIEQIKQFINEFPEFVFVDFKEYHLPDIFKKQYNKEGLIILPQHYDSDGFFICKLQKVAG